MTQSLEDALDKIAADNDLTTISVGRMPYRDCVIYTATVHYNGYSRNGAGCSSGQSKDGVRSGLAKALAKAAVDRAPRNFPVQ